MAEQDLELYDADGNLIEDAKDKYVPKETADRMLAEKLAEKDTELAATRAKLAGLENKDFNFKKLREMKQEEMAKLSTQEIELRQRQEAVEEETKKLREGQETFTKRTIEEYRDDAIGIAIGDDEEVKKKVLFHYDRIKDEATTKEQIRKKVRDAVKLAQDENAGNPLFRGTPNLGSGDPPRRGKNFSDTEAGKAFAKSLGMSFAQDKK